MVKSAIVSKREDTGGTGVGVAGTLALSLAFWEREEDKMTP